MGLSSLPGEAEGGVYVRGEKWVQEAAEAQSPITPGSAIVRGSSDTSALEAPSSSTSLLGVALENDYKADDYGTLSEGDTPHLEDFEAGEEVHYNEAVNAVHEMILKDGEDVEAGDLLVVASGGELQKYDGANDDADHAHFRARESVDNTGGGSDTSRIQALRVR